MSYNILADQLCHPEWFTYASKQVCDFKFRGHRIVEEIATSSASLICLQEVDRIDDFYDEKLKALGFNVIYGRREKTRTFGAGPDIEHHTLAICYKAEEWVLIDEELIDFSDLAKVYPDLPEF